MDEHDIRALCHRYMDAVEAADLDTIARLASPEIRYWDSVTAEEHDHGALLAMVKAGAKAVERRSYDSRQIHVFDHGFMAQYALALTGRDRSTTTLWGALTARCFDGQLTRIDDYLDATKFDRALLFAPA